jgi:hypothetical protein
MLGLVVRCCFNLLNFMSLVLYGGGIIDARGSVSGTTMSRSKFGATHRAKVSPIQPKTGRQLLSRAGLAFWSAQWSVTLTGAQRAAWNAFALTAPVTNVYGQTAYLTGHQWYVRANINIASGGGAPVVAVPGATSYPALTTLTITSDHTAGNELIVTWTSPALPGVPALYVLCAPNLSPGLSSVNNKFRLIGCFGGVVSPLNLGFQYMDRFSQVSPVAGKQTFVMALMVDLGSGLASAPLVSSTIVT